MEVKTFEGGAHIPHYKSFTEDKPIERMAAPSEVIIPLHQTSGAPCEPLVKEGDKVKIGQKIGDCEEFFSAPVHASISGTVKAVEPRMTYTGKEDQCVVIEADDGPQEFEMKQVRDPDTVSVDEYRKCVREGGVAGMGGAALPTHVQTAPRQPVDTLLLNGAECEPFLTCDHRLMLERAADLVKGAELKMKSIGARRTLFGIEVNKPDAIEAVNEQIKDRDDMEVVPLAVKYPQGFKSHLIKAATGRDVPRGARSAELGCIVRNVGTTVAAYEATVYDKPLIERIVTVSGPKVGKPGNYIIKIGTPLYHIVEQCDIGDLEGCKIVLGGPMTGLAQSDLNSSVVKSSTGVIVLPPEMVRDTMEYMDCVRCGKCVDHCPMFLYPSEISIYAEAEMHEEANEWNILDCIECGICSYVCPSHRPIVHMVQRFSPEVEKMIKKR